MSAQFTLPLQVVIPGQLIASSLWNNEWANLNVNFIPAGMDSYSDTDVQMQIQTAPYPGSVTSHAANLGGEIERIRYQISAMLGATTPAYWYAKPPTDLTTVAATNIPIGGVIDYPTATPPSSNYHLADGTAINRTIYATLFTLIGTTFGTGDGTTTFNLPNYTDRLSIGSGNLYAVASTGGAVNHTLSIPEMPSHKHTAVDSGHTHTEKATQNVGGQNSVQGFVGDGSNGSVSNTTGAGSANITVGNTGGGSAFSILNPYISMYKLIRIL